MTCDSQEIATDSEETTAYSLEMTANIEETAGHSREMTNHTGFSTVQRLERAVGCRFMRIFA